MKTAIKVLIILSMVVGAIYIFPLVVGAIALNKMKAGRPSTAMSIVVLLFCNTIAGILMLVAKDSDFAPAAPAASATFSQPTAAPTERPRTSSDNNIKNL